MNSFLRTTAILFRAHLVRTLRTRRCLVAVLLCAVPVGISTLVATISRFEGPPPLEVLQTILWHLQVQILVPLVALIFGSAVVAEEIEDRTITYLFTRPIQRAAILVGRWLAALVPLLTALGASAALVLHLLGGLGSRDGADWMPEGFRWRTMVVVLAGGAVYSALFAAAGALFKRPILIGLGYTFVYELILGNLPGSNQKATVQYYLKSFLLGGDDEVLRRFENTIAIVPLAEPFAAARSLVLILVAGLALGAWRLSRREYVLSA